MTDDLVLRQTRAMEDIRAWVEFENRQRLIDVLTATLTDTKHLRAYDLSDGTRTQSEIGKAVGLSQPTMSGLWTRWRRLGLVTIQEDGRARHLESASNMGIRNVVVDATPKRRKAGEADGAREK